MEPRIIIAYSLIAVLVVGAAIASVVIGRRRAARRRRLRGIKDYDTAR